MDTMSLIDEYVEQDKRLQDPEVKREILANNLGLNFERLVKIGKGTYEIHYTNIYGDEIPLRVISRDEETYLQHDCVSEMAKKFPLFKGAIYNVNFEKMFQKKLISLATSVSVHTPSKRHFTEDDVGSLPSYTLAALITEYQRLEREYNPVINAIDDEQIDFLLARLLDPEKKSITMTGLTSNQTSSSLSRLLDILIELEVNTSITASLIDTLPEEQN